MADNTDVFFWSKTLKNLSPIIPGRVKYLSKSTEEGNCPIVPSLYKLENTLKSMFKETGTEKSEQRKTVEGLLKEFLPQEDQKIIQDSVPNKVIEMFYKVAKGLVDTYGYKEGSANTSNPAKIRMSKADIDAEYDRLVKRLEELDNSPNQKVGERDEIVKQMQKLFQYQ